MIEIERLLHKIKTVDKLSMKRCKDILDSKMKPKGSLGIMEELAIKVAGITGKSLNVLKNGLHLILAGDNGVVEENISACPQEYTRIVSEEILSSLAAVSIFCKNLNIPFQLIDVGINGKIDREYPNLKRKKIAYGSRNFLKEPALTRREVKEAISLGVKLIEENVERDFFSIGEMGIGNTTTSSAILCALIGKKIEAVVGYGSGIAESGLDKKRKVVREVVEKYNLFEKTPLEILQIVGGLDIATMVGVYIGCAIYRKPLLLDGFISSVAAILAVRLEPKIRDYLIATHISEERGMKIALEELGYTPFLHMSMRLGEGTGAVLSYPIFKIALDIPISMKTEEEIYSLLK